MTPTCAQPYPRACGRHQVIGIEFSRRGVRGFYHLYTEAPDRELAPVGTITRIRRPLSPSSAVRVPCPICRCDVAATTLGEAAEILQVTDAALEMLMRSGRVHVIAMVTGIRLNRSTLEPLEPF